MGIRSRVHSCHHTQCGPHTGPILSLSTGHTRCSHHDRVTHWPPTVGFFCLSLLLHTMPSQGLGSQAVISQSTSAVVSLSGRFTSAPLQPWITRGSPCGLGEMMHCHTGRGPLGGPRCEARPALAHRRGLHSTAGTVLIPHLHSTQVVAGEFHQLSPLCMLSRAGGGHVSWPLTTLMPRRPWVIPWPASCVENCSSLQITGDSAYY